MPGVWGTEHERFWAKVDKDAAVQPHMATNCWEWTAYRRPNSYGLFKLHGKYGRRVHAHRWAWEELHGPILNDLEIDHVCRNPLCVRPDHLDLVTHQENVRRALPYRRDMKRTHCVLRGHEFTEENTYIWGNNRSCKKCRFIRESTKRSMRKTLIGSEL